MREQVLQDRDQGLWTSRIPVRRASRQQNAKKLAFHALEGA